MSDPVCRDGQGRDEWAPSTYGKSAAEFGVGGIRGRVGDLVFKQYSYGTVVTRVPRMADIEWSPAQRAHRARVRAAAKFYREVLADAALKKKYRAIAAKKKIPLPAATLAAFMKREREAMTGKTARRG